MTAPRFDHVLEVAADLTAIDHPDTCRPHQHRCPVGKLIGDAAAAGLPAGRYWAGVNDVGDRLLIGDPVQPRHTAPAPAAPDVLALLRGVGDRAALGIRTSISHADALTLLYAATIGERAELGRLVRDLLPFHLVLPGTGQPWPGCANCHGAGETPAVDDLGPQHCHCRCDLCMCGDALCAGPCNAVAVMLSALVLHGVPAPAVDVPRTLTALHHAGVRRIVAAVTGRRASIVDQVDGQPAAVEVTVGDERQATAVERGLRDEGYRCERRPVPGPVTAVRLLVAHSN